MKKRIAMIFFTIMLFTCSSLFAFAEESSFTVISPTITSSSSIVYSDNLLISIKVAQGKNLLINLYYYPETTYSSAGAIKSAGVLVSGPHSFTSNNQLNFFTTQVNDIKHGLYCLSIDTVDAKGVIIDSEKQYFLTKGKQDEAPATKLFDNEVSNAMQFFQNLFKNIFGN